MVEFNGFPEAGWQFFEQLAENNSKEWFDDHKDDYITYVREPAIAFVEVLGKRLQAISQGIRYDTSTNGSGSLMRINRDIRFSNDKSPYKTNIALMFWEGDGKKMEAPAFGYQFEPTGGGAMSGMFGFSKPMLQAYREAVDNHETGQALVEAVDAVTSTQGYQVMGTHYKKVPRGYPADHPRAELLKYNGLHARSPMIDRETLTKPELVDICFEHARTMAPIQRWLVQISIKQG